MQILLPDGHLMTFNKLIRIAEYPMRADKSAHTDDRISLLICINWALQDYFYEGVLPQSGWHGHPQGAPHHATPPLSLRRRTSDTRLGGEPWLARTPTRGPTPHHPCPYDIGHRTSDTQMVMELSLLSSLEIGFIIIGT